MSRTSHERAAMTDPNRQLLELLKDPTGKKK
jgi:hypothetical protein